jgi:hypothetical protein
MLTFDEVRKNGLLLYEYIRGSHACGINRPGSDIDKGGIYMEPKDSLFGLGIDQQDEIHDKKQDVCWNSFGKYMKLLVKSNPSVLESLFIPSRCILFEHPIITELKKSKDTFITKDCFKPFLEYSTEQIKKARSLNKKVVRPMSGVRRGVLDFVYCRYKQGSRPLGGWLEETGLKQQYCGLVNISNMIGMFGLYYDWGAHLQAELSILNQPELVKYLGDDSIQTSFKKSLLENIGDKPLSEWWKLYKKPIGYKGIVNKEDTSNEVRLSSVIEKVKPLIDVSYYKDGYTVYCKQYAQWVEWNKNKNEERFKEVVDHKGYDCKNAAHSIRLMNMGIEIAKGEGVKIDRTGIDAEFLLSIRTGNSSYDEIIGYIDSKNEEMMKAMKDSKILETVDLEKVNELMIGLRRKFYEGKI